MRGSGREPVEVLTPVVNPRYTFLVWHTMPRKFTHAQRPGPIHLDAAVVASSRSRSLRSSGWMRTYHPMVCVGGPCRALEFRHQVVRHSESLGEGAAKAELRLQGQTPSSGSNAE